jgi:hypothetical protein
LATGVENNLGDTTPQTGKLPWRSTVVAQIALKFIQSFLVDSRSTSICFNTQIGFPDKLLGNVIRLGHWGILLPFARLI